MPTIVWPKCEKSMEPGFVLDKTYHDRYFSTPEWAEGMPESSWWTGLDLEGRDRHPVTTYRCSGCGYLESYAVTP